MTLAGDNVNSIPNQYAKAAKAGGLRCVLMDVGGNDCLLNNNGDAALAAAKTLFETMGQDKIEKVQCFFYPDPFSRKYDSLKTCFDALRPKMQALCEGLTTPKMSLAGPAPHLERAGVASIRLAGMDPAR
jgi:hypothetical protein